jgi:hypothetical protein
MYLVAPILKDTVAEVTAMFPKFRGLKADKGKQVT